MENKDNFKEEKFDSFINKIIILSSKAYFKKQMKIVNKEKTIIDDEENSILEGVSVLNSALSATTIAGIENVLELNNAIQSLSAIEQSVIFLLFKEDLSQEDAAKILEICSKSVSRIKLRAIDKLRKYIKGDVKNDR